MHQRAWKGSVNREKGDLDQFRDSSFCCQDIISKHHSQISNNSPIQKKPRDCQSARVHRSGKRLPEYHVKLFGAFLSMTSEENDDQQRRGGPMPQHCPLSVGLYLHCFQTCVLLSVHSSKISRALCTGSSQKDTMCLFSAKHSPMCLPRGKHPLKRQFPEKHYMTLLVLQRN